MFKYAEIADLVYFWFAANTTAGAAGDGATPTYVVRLAGAAAGAAKIASGTPALLTHADYSDGSYEIGIDTTGYAAGEYAVFCSLTISTVNPVGFVGSFKLRTAGTSALKTDLVSVNGAAQTATLDTLKADTAAIKVPTDKLVFTVANQVDSNVITKTGFALSATGADLILHGATFMVACATAIWELAARTITALPAVATDWLTAAGVKADAVTKIQAGLATPTNITAGTIATVTNLTNAPTNGDLTAAMKASVNAEVVDTLNVDTLAEMAQGAPPASPTMRQVLNYLYRKLRNKQETTATVNSVYDDAGTTVLFKETHGDDATTFSRGKYGTGA